MPAGASSSFIVANDQVLDTPIDYANVRTLKADLGSASVIVIDDTVSVEWIIERTIHFFAFAAIALFAIAHVVMVAATGFRTHMRGMTIGDRS